MFLSLVRPDKISSPITSTAAVTISFAASFFIALAPKLPRACHFVDKEAIWHSVEYQTNPRLCRGMIPLPPPAGKCVRDRADKIPAKSTLSADRFRLARGSLRDGGRRQ